VGIFPVNLGVEMCSSQIQSLELKEEKLSSRFDLLQDNWNALEKEVKESILEASKLYFEINPTASKITLDSNKDGGVILTISEAVEAAEEENYELDSLEETLERLYILLLTCEELVFSKDTTLEMLNTQLKD
jgi:hypothetical protein